MSSSQSAEVAEDLQIKNEINSAESKPIQVSRKRSLEDDENDTNIKSFRVAEANEDNITDTNTPSDLSTGVIKINNSANETNTIDHTKLIANHYNLLEEKGLEYRDQSRIVYMRNFNNWIKSMLINEYMQKLKQVNRGAGLKVMDMCCGKGGDLLKWLKGNVRHLICADIADISIEQCRNRYDDLFKKDQGRRGFEPIFSAEFIVADCTKIQLRTKFKDPSNQLDLVSCQFAFHYSFESLPQAEMMLKNASETLKPGGYFIGTIPDAYDIVSRWQESETNKFGNDVYSIEFMSEMKEKPSLFGAKYNFHLEGVVNCPEFLVYLPLLEKLALKFDLKLVMFERFEDFYERMKVEGRSLLNKMQGLETYPECHDSPLVSKNPKEYQHAVQYIENKTGHRKIGTLSQSEWEATSLYAVFAFQKQKASWIDEGKSKNEDLKVL